MIFIIDENCLTLRLLVPFCLPLCCFSVYGLNPSVTSPHLHAQLLCCRCVLMLTTFRLLPVLLPLHFLTWSLNSYRHGCWIDELRYHCIQPNFICVTVLVPDGFLGCPAPGLLLQRSSREGAVCVPHQVSSVFVNLSLASVASS